MTDVTEGSRTIVTDGLRVQKTIEADSENMATVTLDITLEHHVPATVRLIEPALRSIPTEEIDLHANHGAEFWTLTDEAVFERNFESDETYTVIYRVGNIDADQGAALAKEPIVERTDGATDSEDPELDNVVHQNNSDLVRELIAGDRSTLAPETESPNTVELSLEDSTDPAPAGSPTSTQSDSEESSIDISSADSQSSASGISDSAEAPKAESDAATIESSSADGDSPHQAASDESPDSQSAMSQGPSGGVARVLLKELQQGYVDDETITDLREELDQSRSKEIRLTHLQSQVSDFSAYIEMLDEFLDRHGTFDSVFEDLEAEVALLGDTVDELQEEFHGLSEAVGDDIDGLETAQQDLTTQLEDIQEELSAVNTRLDEFDEFKTRLSGAFQGLNAPDTE